MGTHGAIRLGRVPKQQQQNVGQGNQRAVAGTHQSRPPRPIKLYCAMRLQKGELFKKAQTLKQTPKFARTSITSDLTEDQMMIQQEVQLIHNVASKTPNVTSKMKGSAVNRWQNPGP